MIVMKVTLRSQISIFLYRPFITALFVIAEDLRRVPGALLYRGRYNKTADPYAAIASQTSMARRLLGLIGYEDDAMVGLGMCQNCVPAAVDRL
jgi:Flp pilus assembly CpaE family ATPase